MLRSLQLEGDSLLFLQQQLVGELRGEEKIFATRIVSDGEPERRRGIAPSVEDATILARQELPSAATEIEIKTLSAPSRTWLRVTAGDEDGAKAIALREGRNAVQAPTIKGLRELRHDRNFLDVLRRRRHYEVDVDSPAVVEICYKRVAKLNAWLTSGPITRTRPYEAQLYNDVGVNCKFEIPKQWSPLGATVDSLHPATRFFVLGVRASQEGLEGKMNFVPGKISDDLRDCEARRAFLENQIRKEILDGFAFHNIRYRKDMESVAGEDNTIVASAEFVGHDGLGQVVLSTVHDELHYMFEYYGPLNDFISDSIELLRSSFVFPPMETVESLLSGKRRFLSPAHAEWKA